MKLTEKQAKDIEQFWFENYLKDHHYDLYPGTLDDDLPESFDNWVSTLGDVEIFRLSEEWHKMQSRWVAEEFIKRNYGTL